MKFQLLSALLIAALNTGCFYRSPSPDSLYVRIGGSERIAKIVDTFAVNCVTDPRINTYFFSVSSDPARLARFKQGLRDQICEVSGGPCTYDGPSMLEAHRGLGISDQEFNAFAEDLVLALTSAQIPEADQELLLGALGPLRREIVEKHS